MSKKRNPESQIRKFGQAMKCLQELAQDGYYLYVAEDTVNLMTGPSHSDSGKSQQHLIVAQARVSRMGGGDW